MKGKGFTLLEILLVIAAIGILAAIVIVAINPQRQLAQVRDAERQSAVNTLQKALEQYLIDTGAYPTGISAASQEVCASGGSVDCLDITNILVPTYLASIPVDPNANGDGSGYSVAINTANGKVSVSTLYPELSVSIGANVTDVSFDFYQEVEVAYSLRRVISSYDGPLIRVRRSSDNSEQDIEMNTEGLLDIAGLELFLAGSTGFITVWYDQGENESHANATGVGTQPRISSTNGQVETANGFPAILFDPTSPSDERDLLATGLSISNANIYAVADFDEDMIANESDLLHLYSSTGSSNYGYRPIRYNYPNNQYVQVVFPNGSGTFMYYNSGNLDQNVYFADIRNGTQILGINGTIIGQNTLSSLSGIPANRLLIGDDFTDGNPFSGHMQELIIFNGDTSANRSEIEGQMNRFYEMF